MFATCGGTKQSPVNIVSFEATEDASLENIELSEEYSTMNTGTWLIENNGHSAQVSVTDGDYFISRGGLGAEFRLSQFHFHWGSEDWQGSEHTVDGKKYPMEIHLVHYNTKYANFSEAADKEDGLAVIAFFFEIDNADNAALEPVIEALDYIVNGVDDWNTVNANCGGTKQSPINIETLEATADSNLGTIQFSDSYSGKPSGNWEINNNGHAVGVSVTSGDYTMRGGGLGDTYKLAQFHFHWGSANWQGSEHTINGKKYPMEIHFVHYNTKYADIGTAIDKADGLAVLGFFYEMDDNDNAALTPIVDKLTDVVFSKNKTAIATMTISDLMGGDLNDVSDFYRYSGSLTTPGCFESVTWTVFAKTLKVSAAQMTKFRSLKDAESKAMVDNYRPTLPLHGRTVYTSIQSGAPSRSLSLSLGLAALALALRNLL